MRFKLKIIDKLSNREINLLKDINIIVEDKEYDYDDLYQMADKTTKKEIELINSEKKGEYNSVADEYSTIVDILISLGDELFDKEDKNSILKVYQSETDTYKKLKIIGIYEYLGGIDTIDLIKGNKYYRVEPKNEFRIVDETNEDYLYTPNCFKDIDNREDN